MKYRISITDMHSDLTSRYYYDAPAILDHSTVMLIGYGHLFLNDWAAQDTTTKVEIFDTTTNKWEPFTP